MEINIKGKRGRGRLKKKWINGIDMRMAGMKGRNIKYRDL